VAIPYLTESAFGASTNTVLPAQFPTLLGLGHGSAERRVPRQHEECLQMVNDCCDTLLVVTSNDHVFALLDAKAGKLARRLGPLATVVIGLRLLGSVVFAIAFLIVLSVLSAPFGFAVIAVSVSVSVIGNLMFDLAAARSLRAIWREWPVDRAEHDPLGFNVAVGRAIRPYEFRKKWCMLFGFPGTAIGCILLFDAGILLTLLLVGASVAFAVVAFFVLTKQQQAATAFDQGEKPLVSKTFTRNAMPSSSTPVSPMQTSAERLIDWFAPCLRTASIHNWRPTIVGGAGMNGIEQDGWAQNTVILTTHGVYLCCVTTPDMEAAQALPEMYMAAKMMQWRNGDQLIAAIREEVESRGWHAVASADPRNFFVSGPAIAHIDVAGPSVSIRPKQGEVIEFTFPNAELAKRFADACVNAGAPCSYQPPKPSVIGDAITSLLGRVADQT
jgi:hypothetical protein